MEGIFGLPQVLRDLEDVKASARPDEGFVPTANRLVDDNEGGDCGLS